MSRLDYTIALFKKLGVEVPETWSEFIHVCETIKGQGVSPLGLDNTEPDYNSYWWYWPVHRTIGHDAAYDILTTKGAPLDDPGWLQATKMTEELLDKGYFQEGFEGSGWPAAQMLFAQGKVAMMLMGAWLPGEVKDAIPDDWVWDSFAFPKVEGGKGEQDSVAVWTNNICIMKDGPNKEVAVEFLKAWSDRDNMEEGMFGVAGANTPIKGVSIPAGLVEPYRILGETKHPVDPYFGLLYRETELYTGGFRPVIDRLFLGDLRDEAFLEALAEARDSYLK
ncbi:MAG: extracellular solute-binding protein [Chloroflexota bacterium]